MVFLPPCQSAAEKQVEEEIGMFLLLYKIFNMALVFFWFGLVFFWRSQFVSRVN